MGEQAKFCRCSALIIVAVNLLTACTHKAVYQTIQQSNESRCRAKVGAEQEQCNKALNQKSFDEYEAERKELIGKSRE